MLFFRGTEVPTGNVSTVRRLLLPLWRGLNKNQFMNCPQGQSTEAVVNRRPLVEFGLYYHCVHRKKVKKQVFFLVHDYSLGPEFQLFSQVAK